MNKENLNEQENRLGKLINKGKIANDKTLVDPAFSDNLKEELLNNYLNLKQDRMEKIRSFLKTKTGMVLSGSFLTLVIATCVGFGSYYYYKAQQPKEGKESEVVAKVKDVKLGGNLAIAEGEVFISEGRSTGILTNWLVAEEGLTISEGLSIKTGAASKAVVIIDDGSAVRLNENSEVQFVTLTANEIVIDQLAGQSYHRVEKDSSREYIVTAIESNEDLQIKALGTAFDVNWGEVKTIKCIESKVQVRYAKNQPEELVTEGEELKLGENAEVKGIDAESLDNDWYAFNKTQDKVVMAKMGIFANEEAPSLEVTEPVDGFETTNGTVNIKGTTESANTIKIKVGENWELLTNNGGSFEKEVTLNTGNNAFEIRVYSPAGMKTLKTVNVTKKEIAVVAPKPTPTPAPTPQPTNVFRISGISSPVAGKVSVNWEMSGYDEKNGFKVVFSKNTNPEYPNRNGDYYHYTSEKSARSAAFTHEQLKSGGTFHVRVCRYWAGESGIKCDIYTDDRTVELGAVAEPDWGTPALSLTKGTQSGRTVNLNWTIANGSSASGFKVVWSTSHNPTYPQNQSAQVVEEKETFWSKVFGIFKPSPVYAVVEDPAMKTWGYQYLSNTDVRSTSVTLGASEYAPGTYYFRVGRYRGGYCDYYSNEVEVVIE